MTTAIPTSDRIQEGFEKIDHDLNYVMNCFRDVLQNLGETEIAEQLPWIGKSDKNPLEHHQVTPALLQAVTISFQLLNMVEENTSNQIRRKIERLNGLASERGLWAWYLNQLQDANWTPEEVATLLPFVRVEPVLTAHPTEAKRVTVMEQHRELYVHLLELENQMYTPLERNRIESRIKAVLERLWRTGETLLEKPTVALERASLMHYLTNVFPKAIRITDQNLLDAWENAGWARETIEDPVKWPRIRFGTWVGGDRDGHPLVTPRVTRETLLDLRQNALSLLTGELENLRAKLSLSALLTAPPSLLKEQLEQLSHNPATASDFIATRNPNEPWRQFVSHMLQRIPPASLDPSEQADTDRYYHFGYELAEDIRTLRRSLLDVGAKAIVQADVDPVLRLTEVFGFHLASLDIRQNSGYHDAAMDQILACAGMEDTKYSSWSEEKKLQFFDEQLTHIEPLLGVAEKPGPEAEGAIGAFREISRHINLYGEEGIGSVILSMTRSPADLFAIYFIAREAGLLRKLDSGIICIVPLVPLLETIDDLLQGPAILDRFLSHPITKNSLRWRHRKNSIFTKKGTQTKPPQSTSIGAIDLPVQQVMVGYSDSNKDSGILASQMTLYHTQIKIAQTVKKHGIRVRVFHGRGGTVSRGAGPTHRFLEALPGNGIQCDIRLTEQGETIGQKYANLVTASHHLELLLSGTTYFSLSAKNAEPEITDDLNEIFDLLANSSRKVYKDLLNEPDFMTFYSGATPLDALEKSRIGSRPSRRSGAKTLSDLRAIPWVFSWSQSRFFLPGWYGVGSALASLTESQFTHLQENLSVWPLIRYVMTNIETSHSSADPALMKCYADMVGDEVIRNRFMKIITDEYNRTGEYLLKLFGNTQSQRRPRLDKTLQPRATALKALHLKQIHLLKKWRASPAKAAESDKLVDEILLTINAIASGLRTTG